MTEWVFVLTPLLVLPIVLLFRFVGCGLDVVGRAKPPLETFPDPKPNPKPKPKPPADPPVLTPDTTPSKYKDTILLEPSVIAYWRLVDDAASTVTKDEKSFRNGTYIEKYALPAVAPAGPNAGSEGRNPALLKTGQNSLIDSDPKVDGGHVLVPFLPGLFTDEFTIEAWVRAEPFIPDYEYTLFDAVGRYSSPPSPVADRGFRLFVNRQKSWQVRSGQSMADLFPSLQLVPLGNRTHVALPVENVGVQKMATLYVDGRAVTPVPVSGYNRNDEANPAGRPRLRHPVLCRIQEVVLHNKALSQAAIKNHVDINR